MTVFKATFQIVKKYRLTIILYTIILIFFAGINFQTNDTSTEFVSEKPDILIVNQDENIGITKNLVDYLNAKCNVKDIDLEDDKISDALFYRDISYIVYVPKNYREDFLAGKSTQIEVKSTKDYEASLAEIILNKYLRIANAYRQNVTDENEIINMINKTTQEEVITEMTSKIDSYGLARASSYFNFLNYSILAGLVYVLCLVLASFKAKNINQKIVISSMNYKIFNYQLLLSNAIVALVMWFFYVLLSFILIGKIMFSFHGLLYITNSLVFTLCALTIAFLVGNLINNKDAINGIINVISLGSSFLCGAFVPVSLLPDFILKIAHILPSYWYINTNEIIQNMESFTFNFQIFRNIVVVLLFAVSFVIITNLITRKKRVR